MDDISFIIILAVIVFGIIFIFGSSGGSNQQYQEPDPIYCDRCGTKNRWNAEFCRNCGEEIPEFDDENT